jgi:hypothetical protein
MSKILNSLNSYVSFQELFLAVVNPLILKSVEPFIGSEIVEVILTNLKETNPQKSKKFTQIETLKEVSSKIEVNEEAKNLDQLTQYNRKKEVWILGGDRWDYDIGFGGLIMYWHPEKILISWY